MQELKFSFVVPVYNRPEELERLLHSISQLDYTDDFEVVIIEDGSSILCEDVCLRFRESVDINYYFKANSGPGDSRNYGMKRAKGNYFIVLDSDCILPKHYLKTVNEQLLIDYSDCYGGPDAAHKAFTILQKAINYVMTSPLTTGGIRGGKLRIDKFQPRSFNMGISKEAFESSEGFGKIHPGEDPDLAIRLWDLGYESQLIEKAYVYHERRISWKLFFKQVYKFGIARIILNKWHPQTSKWVYWMPFLFCCWLMLSLIGLLFGNMYLLIVLLTYLFLLFIHSSSLNNLKVGLYSVFAVLIQFLGYGIGFFISWYKVKLLKINEYVAFPKMFFK